MNPRLHIYLLTGMLLCLGTGLAPGQANWTGDTSALWSGANWSGAAPVSNGTQALVFNPVNLTGAAITSTSNDLANFTASAITFNNSTMAGVYTLAGNSITLGGNITTTGTTGTPTHLISLDLVLNGTRTVTAITNNNVSISGNISETGGAQGLIKSGAGVLTLSGSNSFTGRLQINQGTVNVSSLTNAGTDSAAGRTAVIQTGNAAQSGILSYTGAAQSTDRQVQVGNGSAAGNTGGGNVSNNGSGPLTFTAPAFNSPDTVASTGRTLTFSGNNADDNTVQGVIADNSASGAISVSKTSGGRWILSGSNTYTGATTVSGGFLRATHANSLGGTTNGTIVNASTTLELANNVTITGEALSLNGNGSSSNGALRNFSGANTWAGPITLVAASKIVVESGSLTLDVTSGNAIAGAFDLNLEVISGNITIADPIATGSGMLTKSGIGSATLTGASTFGGQALLNQGMVSVSSLKDVGTASSLGTGSTTPTIRVGNATVTVTLEYSGSGDSTNRQIQIGSGPANTGGAILQNNGSGALTFSNATFNAADPLATTGDRTLTLGGANTGNNTISGVIQDNVSGAAQISVSKTDAGTWVLGGVNTYTGSTTVTAGSLQVGSGGAGKTGTGNVVVQTGSTILGSGTVQGANFTANTGSSVHVGDSTAVSEIRTLNFTPVSGSGAINFQSGSTTYLGLAPGGPQNADLINIMGTGTNTFSFNGNLTVGPASLSPTAIETFNLLDWAGLAGAGSPSFASRFNFVSLLYGNGDEASGLDLPDVNGSGYAWDISGLTSNGSIALVAVIPEPGRMLMLMLGVLGLTLRRRRLA
jgi:autotransporter-associated beta strand protein